MKKKNLIILLLIPFMIALLGVVTINTTFNFIQTDILSISWSYDDIEAFKLQDNLYPLYAVGVDQDNYPAGEGNKLVWTLENADNSDSNLYAEIVKQGQQYYLKTHACGKVIVTCSNEKGNIFRSMNVVIYDKAALLIQSKIRGSQNNIDQTNYYGEYDLLNHKKVKATIDLEVSVIPESLSDSLSIESISNNISFDLDSKKISVIEKGTANLTLKINADSEKFVEEFNFEVVDDGVNVYSYNDLLDCTNKSTNGEIIVLRKSFESKENAFVMNNGSVVIKDGKPELKSNNVECFGHYDHETDSFNFKNEIYSFTTTYNANFINQWNAFVKSNNGKNTLSDQIKAGLRIQKDFYGNGFTINLHNLTFPVGKQQIVADDGSVIEIPVLDKSNLFRGPLPFYALGDPNNMPLVEAFGQDNIGLYVDGDNIVVNDVNLKNCDFGNLMSNLDYVGTVLETNGDNITIENSRLSNGKNIIRSFSSMNVLIKNCLLSNSRNFLISIGSNEFIPIDETKTYEFTTLNGSKVSAKLNEFLVKDGPGDKILNSYIEGTFNDKNAIKNSLLSLQSAFENRDSIENIYKGKVIVEDTLFAQSGIASIAIETMFNGPFLYCECPTSISTILGMLTSQDGVSLGKFKARNVSGLSYPVELELKGTTKFYDYKTQESLDITGLIKENISNFANSFQGDVNRLINVDDIFPIKTYLYNEAKKLGYLYQDAYLNIPIAFYGGGLNASTVKYDELKDYEQIANIIDVDFLKNYLSLQNSDNQLVLIKNMMLKAVTIVTGYEPFKFICYKGNGYLFGESPRVSELIKNAKGE